MDTNEIVGLVVAVLGFIGTMVARWNETNPELSTIARVSRVFDLTQVVDSTRRLDDPAPRPPE
jgi:hypothetical protein